MSKQVSQSFKDTIKVYLDSRAAEDELFAKSYANEKKSIDECCDYIVQEVQKMGVHGLADDDVYGLAVHYYDESYLGEIKGAGCKVVVNHHIELTEEERAEARRMAVERYTQDEVRRMQAANEPSIPVVNKPKLSAQPSKKEIEMPNLFDDMGDEAAK